MRTVILPSWLWTSRYGNRHPQGVIYFPVGSPEKFCLYRSHKTPEKAVASAESLNKTHTGLLKIIGGGEIEFEAVMFSK